VVGTSPHTDFPYELLCDELNSECGVAFDARIYDPGGVRGFLERFQALAAEVCAHPDRSLGAVLAHT
jgi:hypothetical protein